MSGIDERVLKAYLRDLVAAARRAERVLISLRIHHTDETMAESREADGHVQHATQEVVEAVCRGGGS